ncbi:energy transducer TonB [Vibrio ziniensis]|uniref:Energy transducer TonB n=1 Tax=Vibrio ziniensis TaxID=2711221 RepID=A0A6G7CMA2_9VIBR|nr:energy transducer TonB [Vibrio ziniensis]QIH43257.1 energy transducer TonB [Vibrio ziniensis]
MTRLRYLIAGLIACLIHGIALSYTPQKNTINVSTEEGSQSLQIQLISISANTPVDPLIEEKNKEQVKPETEPLEQKSVKNEPALPVEKNKPVSSKKLSPKKELPKKVITKKEQPKSKTNTEVVEQKKDIKPEEAVRKTEEIASTEPEQIKEAVNKTEQKKPTPPAKASAQDSKPMLVKKPRFSAKPTPVAYPRVARKNGLEGKVLIEVWLDEQGNQIKQLLLESSGHSVLDERALSTIKEWRFAYQVDQGQAIAHRVQIPINFQLQ